MRLLSTDLPLVPRRSLLSLRVILVSFLIVCLILQVLLHNHISDSSNHHDSIQKQVSFLGSSSSSSLLASLPDGDRLLRHEGIEQQKLQRLIYAGAYSETRNKVNYKENIGNDQQQVAISRSSSSENTIVSSTTNEIPKRKRRSNENRQDREQQQPHHKPSRYYARVVMLQETNNSAAARIGTSSWLYNLPKHHIGVPSSLIEQQLQQFTKNRTLPLHYSNDNPSNPDYQKISKRFKRETQPPNPLDTSLCTPILPPEANRINPTCNEFHSIDFINSIIAKHYSHRTEKRELVLDDDVDGSGDDDGYNKEERRLIATEQQQFKRRSLHSRYHNRNETPLSENNNNSTDEKEIGTSLSLLGVGGWRATWRYDVSSKRKSSTSTTLVLKTLRWKAQDFDQQTFHRHSTDAIASTHLTTGNAALNKIVGIYGYCGQSVLNEFANAGTLVDLVERRERISVDYSKSSPIEAVSSLLVKNHNKVPQEVNVISSNKEEQIIDDGFAWSPYQQLLYALNIVSAVADIHNNHNSKHIPVVVHHDLKPDNIVIVRPEIPTNKNHQVISKGNVDKDSANSNDAKLPGRPKLHNHQIVFKISDFNDAEILQWNQTTTSTDPTNSTESDKLCYFNRKRWFPYYRAREEILEQPILTHKVDIYAMGGILYHLLEGQDPYEDCRLRDAFKSVVMGKLPPLTSVANWTNDVIATALEEEIDENHKGLLQSTTNYRATQAATNDDYEQYLQRVHELCVQPINQMIEWCMSVHPKDRPEAWEVQRDLSIALKNCAYVR